MNAIKRMSLSLTAHMNSLIDQIENHEAVAESVLEDIRNSLLNLRYQIKRIQAENAGFEKRLGVLKHQRATWEDRARRLPTEDHERALECVRRMKAAQDETDSLMEQLTAHQKLEAQLNEQAQNIETRFNELKAKQSAFAGRQSRAEAAKNMSRFDNAGLNQGVFDRWEKKIMHTEAGTELTVETADSLAKEFSKAEEKAELEVLLAEVKAKKE